MSVCEITPVRSWWNPWTWNTPSRSQYEKLRADSDKLAKDTTVRLWMQEFGSKRMLAGTGVVYPNPHTMPAYGQPCWFEAYRERMAWMQYASSVSAMLQQEQNYHPTWDAMEQCLSGGTPA